MCTGEENFSADSYFGAGILKSTNGGSSWTQIKGPFAGYNGYYFYSGADYIGRIAIQPGNSSVILAAVEQASGNNHQCVAVYRTENGGALGGAHCLIHRVGTTAERQFCLIPATETLPMQRRITTVCTNRLMPARPGLASTEPGAMCSLRPMLGESPWLSHRQIRTTLYASIQDTSQTGGVDLFKTTNGGVNWVKLVNTPNYCAQQCWYDQTIAVAPNNPNEVFVGSAYGSFVYRSMDGGSHWTDVTQGANGFYLHADMHALAFSSDSSVLYAGNDGGVWSTNAPTATPVAWTELNDTLAITQFYFSPSINPKNVSDSFGGTQDNGTQKYSGMLTWEDVVCGDGGWTAIDPATPSNVYASCYAGNGLVWKSTAGGVSGSWTYTANGINADWASEFLPPLAIDHLHPTNTQE